MKVISPISIILLLSLVFLSCNNSGTSKIKDLRDLTDSLAAKVLDSATVDKKQTSLIIHYSALAVRKSDSAKTYFKDHFTDTQKQIIYSLNRIDARHRFNPDTLIIPDTFVNDLLAYSPFPKQVKVLDSVNKFVLFSYPIQAFVVYENGKQIRWGATSMGSKIHPTPGGLHFTNWKSKRAISTVKDTWILPWNFNIANRAGVGWHEYEMPGYPASHSCLRLHEDDAKWLYDFANQWILNSKQQLVAKGTPVIVHGKYPFGERRPWLNLLDDPKANNITEEQMTEIVQPHLSEILKQQKIRAEATQPEPTTDSTSNKVS